MIVFWTTVKSAAFPMIVVVCTELDREIHGIYTCMNSNLLKLKIKYSNILRYLFLSFLSCRL